MRIKHVAYREVDRERFAAHHTRVLELARASGGLVDGWAAEHRGDARAVLTFESDDALRAFMEHLHEHTVPPGEGDATSAPFRSAVLHLSQVVDLGARRDAGHVGESIAWVKEGGDEEWLASQRVWTDAMAQCEGFVGGSIVRGRRTWVVTSFWKDAAAHARFVTERVPSLRGATRGDELAARLVRFDGPLLV